MKLPVLAILPAFNEAGRIGPVIRACLDHVEQVTVVDDGSSDGTAETAAAAGANVERHPINRGKGAAIQTAFDAFGRSGLGWLVLLDGDGQHDPADIPALFETARTGGYGMVVGNRMQDTRLMPWVRIATNRFMSWLISRMAGQTIPDTQCGFRLFSRDLALSLHLTTSHFDLESEMLFQASRAGFSIGSCKIKTIYAGESSHIHPVVDTIRFFKLVGRTLRS